MKLILIIISLFLFGCFTDSSKDKPARFKVGDCYTPTVKESWEDINLKVRMVVAVGIEKYRTVYIMEYNRKLGLDDDRIYFIDKDGISVICPLELVNKIKESK